MNMLNHETLFIDNIGEINGHEFRFRHEAEDGFSKLHCYILNSAILPSGQYKMVDGHALWPFAGLELAMQMHNGAPTNKVSFAQTMELARICNRTRKMVHVKIAGITFHFGVNQQTGAKLHGMLVHQHEFRPQQLQTDNGLHWGMALDAQNFIFFEEDGDGAPTMTIANPQALIEGSLLACALTANC
jgi:hypothetical protein